MNNYLVRIVKLVTCFSSKKRNVSLNVALINIAVIKTIMYCVVDNGGGDNTAAIAGGVVGAVLVVVIIVVVVVVVVLLRRRRFRSARFYIFLLSVLQLIYLFNKITYLVLAILLNYHMIY